MKSGGQPPYVFGMFSAARCLRLESGKTQVQRGFTDFLPYLCKPAACSQIQHWCGFAGREAGAFGVVGVLRVKDEQKSVHSAEGSASAGIYSAKGQETEDGKQTESRLIANSKQDKSEAIASEKQNESRLRTAWPMIRNFLSTTSAPRPSRRGCDS
jgi:hypothetical protein